MDVLGATQHGVFRSVLEYTTANLPTCKSKDVLIKVAYSDLNPVDLQKVKGRQDGLAVKDPPFVPGYGGSGIVQEVGANGPQHLLGKEVVFLADPNRMGSYASHIVVDSHCVAALPSSVSLKDAATIPIAGLTAYECLVKLGLVKDVELQKDTATLETVGLATKTSGKDTKSATDATSSLLVVGGSGGVGSWIITLVKNWHPNLQIFVTASSGKSQEWCTKLGATKVFDHRDIAQNCPNGTIDNIICLTEPTQTLFATLSDAIKPYGSICLVVAGASIKNLDLGFCFFKCVNIVTETVFSSIRTKYEHIVPATELNAILKLLANQSIQVPLSPDIINTMTSDRVSIKFKDALDPKLGILKLLSQSSNKRGKLVMMIDAGDCIIILDVKTGSIIPIPRAECIERGILKRIKKKAQNNNNNDLEIWEQESQNKTEKDEMIRKISRNEKLGIVKVAGKTCGDDLEDGLELQEAENVKNLWGVELKKRPKNKEGEELFFVDVRYKSLGELSRKNCIEKGYLTIEKQTIDNNNNNHDATTDNGNNNGGITEIIKEAVTDYDERDDLVQLVRGALHLRLE